MSAKYFVFQNKTIIFPKNFTAMKRLLFIITIATCLLSCAEESWLPDGGGYGSSNGGSNNGSNSGSNSNSNQGTSQSARSGTNQSGRSNDRNNDSTTTFPTVIDYENSEILYLKVYSIGGYTMAFGYEGDRIQLPEKIVADDDTYRFVPNAGFTTPMRMEIYTLNYIKRHDLIEWNTKADGSGESFAPGSYAEFGKVKYLYAITNVEYITISFENDNGIVPEPIEKEKYSYIKSEELPLLPDTDDMKFLEWLWNGENFSMIYDLDADITLTPHYVTPEMYEYLRINHRLPPTGQTTDNSDITAPDTFRASSGLIIDKKNCTITKNGKVYKLYGKYKIVDSSPDLKVQIVDTWQDIKVQKDADFPTKCGKFKEVDAFPNIKIQIVNSFPDLKVKEVTSFPGF